MSEMTREGAADHLEEIMEAMTSDPEPCGIDHVALRHAIAALPAPMPAPVRAIKDMLMREDFDAEAIDRFLKWATAEWPEEAE